MRKISNKFNHKVLKTRILCHFFDIKKSAFPMQKKSNIIPPHQDLLRAEKSLIPLFFATTNNFNSNWAVKKASPAAVCRSSF